MVFEKIDLLSFVSEIEVKKVKKIIRIINDSWLIDQATLGMVLTVSIMIFMFAIDVMVLLLGVKELPRNIDSAQFYLVGVIISVGFVILRQVLCLRRKLWKKKLTDRLYHLHHIMLAVEEYNNMAENDWVVMQQSMQIQQKVNQRFGDPSPDFERYKKELIEKMKNRYQLLSEALAMFQKQEYIDISSKLYQYQSLA